MNIAVVSGRLTANAVVRGKGKVLVFTVETKHTNGDDKESSSFVPCVLFAPSPEIEKSLAAGKGTWVELQGRIDSGRFEGVQQAFNTQVVVFNKTLVVGNR